MFVFATLLSIDYQARIGISGSHISYMTLSLIIVRPSVPGQLHLFGLFVRFIPLNGYALSSIFLRSAFRLLRVLFFFFHPLYHDFPFTGFFRWNSSAHWFSRVSNSLADFHDRFPPLSPNLQFSIYRSPTRPSLAPASDLTFLFPSIM